MDALELIQQQQKDKYPSIEVSRPIPYSIDLGHLAVFDLNHVDSAGLMMAGGEDLCRGVIRDAVQSLITDLWNQPTRTSEDQTLILAKLPSPDFQLPREKPAPAPKSQLLTRWQKFAQEKGIAAKTKRSRLVYDEEAKDWIPRHGYKGKPQQEDWIVEVPANSDPYEDQFAKRGQEKRERILKNKKQQLRNEEEASKKTTTSNASNASRQRKRIDLMNTLKISTKSTASMGRFDKAIEDKTGAVRLKQDKRKFESVVVDVKKENALNAKIAAKIIGSS